MRKSWTIPLLATLAVAAGCNIFGPEPVCGCSPIPIGVSLTPTTATIAVGDSVAIHASVDNPYGTWANGVAWSLSDSTVLTVISDSPLALTAVGSAAGTAVITANAGGGSGQATVTVTAPPANE